MTFKPERFLSSDGTLNDDMSHLMVFGFGRRICPGRHFADASLFIQIASILHSFNIRPPFDDNGLPIQIEPQSGDGLVS